MVSKSGCHLLKPEARDALIKVLLPLASVTTPNLYEAEVITGRNMKSLPDMEKAAVDIIKMGTRSVVVKGRHLEGDAVDVFYDGGRFAALKTKDYPSPMSTGFCTFSSAIAAFWLGGFAVEEAVTRAKEYITGAIAASFPLGGGVGPTHHFYLYYKEDR